VVSEGWVTDSEPEITPGLLLVAIVPLSGTSLTDTLLNVPIPVFEIVPLKL
jgi:hypothetical protein